MYFSPPNLKTWLRTCVQHFPSKKVGQTVRSSAKFIEIFSKYPQVLVLTVFEEPTQYIENACSGEVHVHVTKQNIYDFYNSSLSVAQTIFAKAVF